MNPAREKDNQVGADRRRWLNNYPGRENCVETVVWRRTDRSASQGLPVISRVSQTLDEIEVSQNPRLKDVSAHSYQYSFAPNPNWSNLYAPGAEIRKYLEDVAEKYGATRFIKTSHEVKHAAWDDEQKIW